MNRRVRRVAKKDVTSVEELLEMEKYIEVLCIAAEKRDTAYHGAEK